MALVNVANLHSLVYKAIQDTMHDRGLSLSVASRITCLDCDAMARSVVDAITRASKCPECGGAWDAEHNRCSANCQVIGTDKTEA